MGFDLEGIEAVHDTTVRIPHQSGKKDKEMVIETLTTASKEWNEAVTKDRLQRELSQFVTLNDDGSQNFSSHMSVKLKKAVAGLVTSVSQGSYSTKDKDEIEELFTNPLNFRIPQTVYISVLTAGNDTESDEPEANQKQSSGSSNKLTSTQTVSA